MCCRTGGANLPHGVGDLAPAHQGRLRLDEHGAAHREVAHLMQQLGLKQLLSRLQPSWVVPQDAATVVSRYFQVHHLNHIMRGATKPERIGVVLAAWLSPWGPGEGLPGHPQAVTCQRLTACAATCMNPMLSTCTVTWHMQWLAVAA